MATQSKVVRCAIYTRKSTEEGLQQAFNTLDAQREAGEAYVASQRAEGWTCLPDRYDDGGFTGGNLDRPAVRRLLADIEAGKIDCVVVYKVDRLSRSLLDFARLMEVFDRRGVSFVSVTQHFNTTHSMGRLTLNVLLSFAQFEREILSERTRDKIAAARRKGKFAGGRVVLGYDVLRSPQGPKLIINDDEAAQVRRIFELYLEQGSLIPTVQELAKLGWTTKRWGSQDGRSFDKATLHHLLTNVTYIGKVRYRDELYAGEHEAIIDPSLWQRVQATLARNGRTGGVAVRNRYGALLKGLLRCTPCGCSMGHTYTCKGNKRYRYYVCLNAQKRGWQSCASKSVPAGEMEQFVVDQIRAVGNDPVVLAETVRRVRVQAEAKRVDQRAEEKRLNKEMARLHAALARAKPEDAADLHARVEETEKRLTALRDEIAATVGDVVSESDVAAALVNLGPAWEALVPREQARVIGLLVEGVEYDGAKGTVSVTFRPSGIKALSINVTEVAA